MGYDEINLNCGCPIERVQRGAFGACLMAEPQLVRIASRPWWTWCRGLSPSTPHGIDKSGSMTFVRDFVGHSQRSGFATPSSCMPATPWLEGLESERKPRSAAAAL